MMTEVRREKVGETREENRSLLLGPIEQLVSPAIVLPVQLLPVRTRVPEDDGPRRLMLAVLRDAVHTLTVVRARRNGRPSDEVRDAEEWVSSRDRDHLFAFERICEELEIDPSYIRHGLQAWAAGMRPYIRRRRRRRKSGGAAGAVSPATSSCSRERRRSATVAA